MRYRYLIVFLIGALLPFTAAAQDKNNSAGEETGKDIYEEVAKRHGKPVEFEIQRMTLTDDKGIEEIRSLKRYARTVGPGEHRYLMVFHSPPTIRGASIVTWKRRFKKDGRWIFLPASGSGPVRIVGGGKQNFVMGSDFTAEDLTSEPSEKLSFERRKDEMLDGRLHFVIDVFPDDTEFKKETGYKFRRMWIDKKNYFVTRTDYYDWRDALIKRQTASDFKKVEGDVWRANTHLMENFAKSHKTRIEVIERDFDAASVPMDLFFERTLTSGDHVR
jgi:hypothetical protein